MAVAKLLQHGVNTNDSRLTEITVRGDQVFGSAKPMLNFLMMICRFSVRGEQREVREGLNSGQKFLSLQSS